MIETARYTYTSATDYMGLSLQDMFLFRKALGNVLEREAAARNRDN